MGNFHSVARALRAAAPDADVQICNTAKQIREAARVVFPGQGAMPDCMRTLDASGLRDVVVEAARDKPLLGICVGEQMLFTRSEEGDTPSLGIFPGIVRRFSGPQYASHESADTPAPIQSGRRLKIPHIGWNTVTQVAPHPLWAGIPDNSSFYFVHSYFAAPDNPRLTVGVSQYGQRFTCAVAADNIFAVQFHPEKSAGHGLRLYRNFAQWHP